jgi:hypothetical protein
MDHARVRQILSTLRGALTELEEHPPVPMFNPATIYNLSDQTNVGPPQTGQWVVGRCFGENTLLASRALSETYTQLHNQIQAMITAVERTVANYERTHADSSV